jgi:hypothetical protein
MENPTTSRSVQATADGAIDLMAKLAVLIVAALLFAGYGIREGRSQTLGASVQMPAQGKAERQAALRSSAAERRSAISTTSQRALPPLIERR